MNTGGQSNTYQPIYLYLTCYRTINQATENSMGNSVLKLMLVASNFIHAGKFETRVYRNLHLN